jgi:hypothetical protein
LVEVMRSKELSEMDGDQEVVETVVQTEELEIEKVDRQIGIELVGKEDKRDKVEKKMETSVTIHPRIY